MHYLADDVAAWQIALVTVNNQVLGEGIYRWRSQTTKNYKSIMDSCFNNIEKIMVMIDTNEHYIHRNIDATVLILVFCVAIAQTKCIHLRFVIAANATPLDFGFVIADISGRSNCIKSILEEALNFIIQ